jgi:hypothetical protein
MYKTAAQYLGPSPTMTMNPYNNVINVKENFQHMPVSKQMPVPMQKPMPASESFSLPTAKNTLEMKWEKKQYANFTDPRVWGPAFWFSLHTSAMNYPVNPSPIFRERMKGRILAIPHEIPCPACKPHASAFIEKHKGRLDEIVSSREKLFNFYVDFHNKVNERFNKKVFTYQEAKNLYSGKANVHTLKYE